MEGFPTVTLPARQVLEIAGGAGLRILCTAGSLWLTLDRDMRDVVLQPGDSFTPDSPRRLLLYAFEPSTFALADAAGQRGGARAGGSSVGRRIRRRWVALYRA